MIRESSRFERTVGVLQRYQARFIELYRQNLEGSNRNATRKLSESLSAVQIEKPDSDGMTVVEIDLLDYWRYIEYGTVSHNTSGAPHPSNGGTWSEFISNLRDWVKVKLKPTDNKLDSTTYAVAHKIYNEGIVGRHDFGSAEEKVFSEFEEELVEAFADDIAENALEYFPEYGKKRGDEGFGA